MPIFRRAPRQETGAAPTTAELRAQREAEWATYFRGPSSEADYRQAFLRYSPLYWDIVESTQRGMLRLLVDRVPAEIGVAAIFGLTVLFGKHGKPEDATRATLAILLNDLTPAHAWTLMVALADAWHNAERQPYERRGAAVAEEFGAALRRLASTDAEETGAISAIQEQIADAGV